MNLELINPFITSARHVFDTVFQLSIDVGPPAVLPHTAPSYAVSGVIGISGDVIGNVTISFPAPTARRLASLFTGEAPASLTDDDIADAIGELTDMIVGGARARFEHTRFDMSCPSVIMGKANLVPPHSHARSCVLACICEAGEFAIEISTAGDAEIPNPSVIATIGGGRQTRAGGM